jgi:hypothetical protein
MLTMASTVHQLPFLRDFLSFVNAHFPAPHFDCVDLVDYRMKEKNLYNGTKSTREKGIER